MHWSQDKIALLTGRKSLTTWQSKPESERLSFQPQNRPSRALRFEYLSEYQPMPKDAQDAFSAKYGISFDLNRFDYLQAKAKQRTYSKTSNSWIRSELDCVRVVEKETNLYFDCDLTSKPHAHILFLGLEDPLKPIGFFKMKKAMVIFRAWLEENDFEGAFGRSVASHYKTKLNKRRYSAFGGDWRRAKANIKDNKGMRSKGLDKLSALYLRTGLWVVAPREMQKQEGLIISMPTEKMLKKMLQENPDWMQERLKFSKYE